MDSYELGKDIQLLKEKIDRLEAMSSCFANSDKPFEETVEKAIPEVSRRPRRGDKNKDEDS
jgi:hypothetical protein